MKQALQGCCADAHSLLRSRTAEQRAQRAPSDAMMGAHSEVREAEVQLTHSAPGRAAWSCTPESCAFYALEVMHPAALGAAARHLDCVTDVAHPLYSQ